MKVEAQETVPAPGLPQAPTPPGICPWLAPAPAPAPAWPQLLLPDAAPGLLPPGCCHRATATRLLQHDGLVWP